MFNTSYVNAGVPVLLVVQFPRDGTGSFPIHLINTKREKCYTQRKWWPFRSWGKYKGIWEGGGCFWKVTEARQKLVKHVRKNAKHSPGFASTTHLTPTCPSSQDGGKPSAMETGWMRTWLPGLRPLMPLLGTSSNHFGLSIPHFSQSNKGMLLNLYKILWVTAQKVLCEDRSFFFPLNGNIGSLNRQAASGGNKATMSTKQGSLAHSHYCSWDHLAAAALASPVLVDVFKREAASWVFALEGLKSEGRLVKECTRRNA